MSPNGWTDSELALDWLKNEFDRLTKEKAGDNVRVIILDGHISHLSLEFVQYCVDHNIVCLVYPPHCTHALQGLDVVCFAKMKKEWHDAIDTFEERTLHAVNKEDFLSVFGSAFLKAFDAETVRAAFKATGVHPYDPTVITPRQMKPSEYTSTKTTFPLEQPSPVRRIMAVFNHQPATQFEMDANAHLSPRAEGSVGSPGRPSSPRLPSSPTPNAQTTPSKRRIDANSDPSLFTPSKRRRILTNSLAASSSGSFLVSNAVITSSQHIASPVLERPPPLREPDWDLLHVSRGSLASATKSQLEARCDKLTNELALSRQHVQVGRSIIQSANAQLLVQNLFCKKLNVALKINEGKKRTSKKTKIINDGRGRVMTKESTVQALEAQEAERQAEIEEKERKRVARETKRGLTEEIERMWAREGRRTCKTCHRMDSPMRKTESRWHSSEGSPQKAWQTEETGCC